MPKDYAEDISTLVVVITLINIDQVLVRNPNPRGHWVNTVTSNICVNLALGGVSVDMLTWAKNGICNSQPCCYIALNYMWN